MKVKFGEFNLDSETRQLLRGKNDDVRLSTKAFELLCVLVEQRPKVLDKSALHFRIWPATFVVDANLTVLIAEIRRALADPPRHSQFIRTVHNVGYAFCAPVVDLGLPGQPPRSMNPTRCWLLWNERVFMLTEGDNIVGRDPQCGVWLDASGVSRRHARIRVSKGGDAVQLEDLGSKNGTLVQHLPVKGKAPLKDGEVIQIGSVELKLRIWSDGTSAETERIRARRR
jgi:DNA-binding winged helix-turn-helix (wHTH) protein